MATSPTSGPGGGGSGAGPSLFLTREAVIDAKTVGNHPINWDHAYNNPFDYTPLLALPSGLGITVAFNGTDPGFTFTEAGLWAISLQAAIPVSDATFVGYITSQFGGNLVIPLFNGPAVAGGADVFAAPASGYLQYNISTITGAAGAAYSVAAYLSIVRLA